MTRIKVKKQHGTPEEEIIAGLYFCPIDKRQQKQTNIYIMVGIVELNNVANGYGKISWKLKN